MTMIELINRINEIKTYAGDINASNFNYDEDAETVLHCLFKDISHMGMSSLIEKLNDIRKQYGDINTDYIQKPIEDNSKYFKIII